MSTAVRVIGPGGSKILRGARVFDPVAMETRERDIEMRDGRFVPEGSVRDDDAEVIDASGLFASPGFVDLHAHVFAGQNTGVPPEEFALRSGTTTVIDAGSAGGHLVGALRRSLSHVRDVRFAAFVNISSIGTTSSRLIGELREEYANVDVAIDAIEEHRGFVVGVKIRASRGVGGDFTLEALRRARTVADRVNMPLMVHLGAAGGELDNIMATLRRGDILTHAFTGWEGNVVHDGTQVRPSVIDAVERGVLLDIGHGASGFSLEVADRMLQAGVYPHCISTDLSAGGRAVIGDLPAVMSKFLALGMSLEDIILRSTLWPARAVGLPAGTLDAGQYGDLAVFSLQAGSFTVTDAFGNERQAHSRIEPVMTLVGGNVVFDARR